MTWYASFEREMLVYRCICDNKQSSSGTFEQN